MKHVMKLFGTNKTKKNATVETPSFASELDNIKSVFVTAITHGKVLMERMKVKQDDITKQIDSLKAESASISAVQKDTEKFITNLEGLV